ncbi:hypothetical protein A3C37_02815 [Candidatus Peribacteria bacterium RIFCSPHIGHO2_02_FULL_53_20]|nr:MAG: hypothetical protein A3C37_02815 [Candidatus Peribacteria bacterium RIFCSPHIGHO2_02_FULL_53_20]OGJ66984.1 MAG: hypothetical protein A3B61_00690 [Candidatus Peribacteria bacterium RIFCSPLOWO2_01_FULL_53_10]OGJ69440.1 MAG: hypothetical protein A3G69_03980 [Candidatus Peribacteria bacterium RIFCSPLOWO2_12_FULL_53_10]
MCSLYRFRDLLRTHGDLLLVILLCVGVFFLQVLHLHEAAFPVTDEGSHAEVGRMIVEGFAPYRDFYYPHPPLLPLLIGSGLQLFGGMYPIRFIYLLLNVTSAIPLFLILRRLTGDRFGAVIGVMMYLTYSEMVHHDFRFLALRQLSNVLVIAFASMGILCRQWKYRSSIETVLASLTALLLYPATVNIALLSLLIILRESTKQQRAAQLRHYAAVGSVTIAFLLLFYALVPGSFDQTFLEHFGLPTMSRWGRIQWVMDSDPRDLFFYGSTTASLLLSTALLRGYRWLSLCALSMIGAIFLPAEFWPHYFVTAAFAFAVGAALLPTLLRRMLPVRTVIIPWTIALLILALHIDRTLPSLLAEWNGNRGGDYHQIVAQLRTYPEPVLTFMEPIYAIDAGKKLTQHPYRATRFTTAHMSSLHHINASQFLLLAEDACTIFLTGWDRSFLPPEVLQNWMKLYEVVSDDPRILLTHNPHCS